MITSTLHSWPTVTRMTVERRQDHSQMRGRVDPQPAGRDRLRSQQPAPRTRRHHLGHRHGEHRRPRARRTAAHAAPICATASAHAPPAGTSRSRSPPAATPRSSRANPTRICSACAANRPSQPRTVEAGRRTNSVILRQPDPAASARSAVQITDTASTRRPSNDRGNSTCERPHPAAPEQIPRRGRIRPTGPTGSAATRTNRGAACPHGASRCPQPGQDTSPETSLRSTTTGSGPTLSNDGLRARWNGPSRQPVKASGKGRWHFRTPGPYSGRPHRDATSHPSRREPTTPEHVLTTGDARGPHPAQPERRSTTGRRMWRADGTLP